MLTTDKLRTSNVLVAGLWAAVLALAGCQKPAPAPKPAGTAPLEPPSATLTAKVYLDGTASMNGFALAGAEGQYVQYLGDLDLALQRAWRNPTVDYYRFGSVIERLTGASPYRTAGEAGFYPGGPNYQETRIDRVLDEASPNVMTLIVTDLFQQDADVSALLHSISTKVTANQLALAVLGVKADFNGKVYDVGYSHMSFLWDSQNKVNRRHPFYTLIAGRTADIVHLAEELKAVSQIVKLENLVILAPLVVSSPLDWRAAEITRQKGLTPDIRVVEGARRGALAFRTTRDTDFEFDASFSYNPVPYAPAVRFSKLPPPSMRASLWSRPNFWTHAALRDLAPGAGPKEDAFRLVQNGEKVTLIGRLPKGSLATPGTYSFELTQELKSEDFDLPAFCTAWTMTNADIATYVRNPEAFDGTRTENLSQFVNSAWSGMLAEHRPTLGTIYVFVQQ